MKGNCNSKIKAIFKPYDVTLFNDVKYFVKYFFYSILGFKKSQNWTRFLSDLQSEQGGVDGGRGVDEGLDILLKVFLGYVKTILRQTIAT